MRIVGTELLEIGSLVLKPVLCRVIELLRCKMQVGQSRSILVQSKQILGSQI